jgi:hypothetical protein
MSGNGKIRQYEVDGVLVCRGPLSQAPLTVAGIGALGATYPAGPVLFLLAENLDVPSLLGTQFHHERLGPAHDGYNRSLFLQIETVMYAAISIDPLLRLIWQYAKSELAGAILSIPWPLDFEVSRWRLTECADMYPAHIDCGDLIHSATDKEIEHLAAAGIELKFTRNLEKPHWALKTKSQIDRCSTGIELKFTRNVEKSHWAFKTKSQIDSAIPPAVAL